MKTSAVVVLGMMAFGCSAFAGAPEKNPVDSLEGRYGFNWLNSPSQEKCVPIEGKLLKEFKKDYQCNLEESPTSSGKPHVLCTRKDETRQYMVFKTKALCEEERETQQANSDEG